MVCVNLGDVMGFVLRQERGPQLTLDFGRNMTALPNGVRANEAVVVVGTLDAGNSQPGSPGAALSTGGPPQSPFLERAAGGGAS